MRRSDEMVLTNRDEIGHLFLNIIPDPNLGTNEHSAVGKKQRNSHVKM